MARLALKRLGLIGKGVERDRRPSDEELERLIRHFDDKPRQTIPMGAVVRFAVATAMRQEEIFKVVWDDYAARTKMLTIRDRKDPREKAGNDQRIPLLSVSGFDPVALIEGQRPARSNADLRIFQFNHRSAGTAFTRACKSLGITDLHFHDLRHEGTSRLFEAGFQIQQVALVTGHKSLAYCPNDDTPKRAEGPLSGHRLISQTDAYAAFAGPAPEPGTDVTDQSAPTSPRHRLPRCLDSAPYSRVCGGPAEAGMREDCPSSCTPAPPLYVADYGYHSPADPDRSSEPADRRAARIAWCRCADLARPAWEKPVILTMRAEIQPRSNRITRWLGDLERDRSPCLLLDDY